MKKEIKSGIIMALSFLLTISLVGITYAAWVDITNVNNGETLSSITFNKVLENQRTLKTSISNIPILPTGAVMTFNLATCPPGWTAFSQANGKFIIGMGSDGQGNTYGLLSGGGEAKHTLTTSELPSHTHQEHYTGGGDTGILGAIGMHSTINSAGNIPGIYTEPTGGGNSHENRPPYLALLYCVKN